MSVLTDLQRVDRLFLWRQAPGIQPRPNLVPAGEWCVELVCSGRGFVRHEGTWLPVGPGALLWHCPGEETIGRSEAADPYTCLTAHLTVSTTAVRPAARLSQWDDVPAREQFAREALAQSAAGVDREGLLLWLVGRLLLAARPVTPEVPTDAWNTCPDPAIAAAMTRLAADPARDPGVAALAVAADMPVRTFARRFLAAVGITPHQHLQRLRTSLAKTLLLDPQRSVAEVAHACGFADASHFGRVFRRYAGDSPAAWRRR